MKNIIITSVLFLISHSLVLGHEDDNWRILFSNTQNLGRKIMLMNGAQDPNSFEPELSLIKNSMKALVKTGDLQKKVFKFKFGGSREEFLLFLSKGNHLSKLGRKFGDFTASEMLDIAKYFRGFEFKEKGTVTLEVYLPAKELEAFSKIIEELKEKK